MPSAKPTWASCRVGIRSPTAEMVSTLVWQFSLTMTKPRSTLDSGFGVPEAVGDGTAADRDEQQLGGHGLAVLQGDCHAAVGVLDAGEALSQARS